jgi:hypothetical protein
MSFIGGIVVGAFVIGFLLWVRSKQSSLTWYEWLLLAIGVILLLWTIPNVVNSFKEIEPTAGWMFLLVIGLPALILFAIVWQLVLRRVRST